MKRITALAAAALMLCSCGGQPALVTSQTVTSASESTSAPASEAVTETETASAETDGGIYGRFSRFGTAERLEGTTVIVSVFADDESTSWHDENGRLRDLAYNNLKISAEWIESETAVYGKENRFVWDWKENSDICCEASLADDITGRASFDYDYKSFYEPWKYIENNIDTAYLLEKYSADNILFIFFFNTPADTESTSRTCAVRDDVKTGRPYEMVFSFMQSCGFDESPANLTHEIFHAFGAPDLYFAGRYGITQEYVDYAEREGLNDIMRTTFDKDSSEPRYDAVTNEITDITAYYLCLSESSETVEKWGFAPNELTNENFME